MGYFHRWTLVKHTPGGHDHDQKDHGNWADGGGGVVTAEELNQFKESLYDWANSTAAHLYKQKGIGYSFFAPQAGAVQDALDAAFTEFVEQARDDKSVWGDEEEIKRLVLAPVAAAILQAGLRGSKYAGFGPKSITNAFSKRPEGDKPEFLKLSREWAARAKRMT
jgi:hypothetical protein